MTYSDAQFGGYPMQFEQEEPRTGFLMPVGEELARMPLDQVVGTLTNPMYVDAQIRDYYRLAGADDASAHYKTAQAMRDAQNQGREFFIGYRGNPEIEVVVQRLVDAPRSGASGLDYGILGRLSDPERAVLVRDAGIEVRPTDFALPADFADYQAGAAQLAELKEEPWVDATALVAPDRSVTYIYVDGNITLAAVASMVSREVPLREVKVCATDPAAALSTASEEALPAPVASEDEASTAESVYVGDDHPAAGDWNGSRPASRRKAPPALPSSEDSQSDSPSAPWMVGVVFYG
jgi:hypothetical protein